nr:uncharacterized protein LOC109193128 [Ipomoea trifida]
MEDSVSNPSSRRNSGTNCAMISSNPSKRHAIASGSKSFAHQSLKRISLLDCGKVGRGAGGQIALFLLKVAALESVRRISKSKCPPVWSGLQALQVVCYPPFKWISRWNPFGMLVKGMQMLSRPLLVLSIATAFSDNPECSDSTTESNEVSQEHINPHDVSEFEPELSSAQSTTTLRVEDDPQQSVLPANWLPRLYKELENQGITLTDRINEEELHRFYTAADGDFLRLLSSVKKTIHWRETYRILSGQELEMWTSMVFWHGFDTKQHPILIVRLGLACSSLPFSDRPRFGQAVVSQVYHGTMHLADRENPQITVLVDCEGLSPLRLPMQMIRTCCTLLQNHFPNALGCLFVIRLPSIARVVAQTFVQVFKPVTRQKLRFLGDTYKNVLSECIETLPSYLGGSCTCLRCDIHKMRDDLYIHEDMPETGADSKHDDDLPSALSGEQTYAPYGARSLDEMLRMAIVGVLIIWVLFASIAVIYDP